MRRRKLCALSPLALRLALAAAVACALATSAPAPAAAADARTRTITVHYRAHDGAARRAYVLLPASYRPKHDPPLPLIISPHGRGVGARANLQLWGALPARGGFAVISPDGEGRKLPRYSWGSAGQIDDLARMPVIMHLTLPWLHVDHHRIYAFGGSMGGQETLLLLARHPRLLAGVAAFDSVTDFALQYRHFTDVPCNRRCKRTWNGPIGSSLRSLARQEIGGTPSTRPLAYAERSPSTYARTIAASCVRLQLWWSVKDQIVSGQQRQSGALFQRILALNRRAPVIGYVGTWRHSAEMHAKSRLPAALATFGLLPSFERSWLSGLRVLAPNVLSGCSA
jgi:dipeptidyl aminopeptidase/acylaminoacyl peptidase